MPSAQIASFHTAWEMGLGDMLVVNPWTPHYSHGTPTDDGCIAIISERHLKVAPLQTAAHCTRSQGMEIMQHGR